MAKTMEERGHGRVTLRTRSGYKLRVGFDKKADGRWKISTIGAAEGITALLPYSSEPASCSGRSSSSAPAWCWVSPVLSFCS